MLSYPICANYLMSILGKPRLSDTGTFHLSPGEKIPGLFSIMVNDVKNRQRTNGEIPKLS